MSGGGAYSIRDAVGQLAINLARRQHLRASAGSIQTPKNRESIPLGLLGQRIMKYSACAQDGPQEMERN